MAAASAGSRCLRIASSSTMEDGCSRLCRSYEGTWCGLGLRNMQERIEKLDGTLRILSSKSGTVIEAQVPLSHLLPPESKAKESA